MSKNVQIPEELLREVWILLTFPDIPNWDFLRRSALEEIEKKINKMIDREIYTKYKTAPTPEQREKARQEYLSRKGIPEGFRW